MKFKELFSCKMECSHGSQCLHPPVAWINSWMHDGVLVFAKGTLQSPHQRPPLSHSVLFFSRVITWGHSSAQCWNMAWSTAIWWHFCPPAPTDQRHQQKMAEWWWATVRRSIMCRRYSQSLVHLWLQRLLKVIVLSLTLNHKVRNKYSQIELSYWKIYSVEMLVM